MFKKEHFLVKFRKKYGVFRNFREKNVQKGTF